MKPRPDLRPAAPVVEPSGFLPLDAPALQAARDERDGPSPAARRTMAQRLSSLSMLAAALALVVAGLALNVATFVMQRAALEEDATAQAQLIAPNVLAALLFGDRASAQESLDSLQRAPRVARATLYDTALKPVADYRRAAEGGAAAAAAPPLARPSAGTTTADHELVVVEPVRGNAGPAGWLRLQIPLTPLYRTAAIFGLITAAAATLAMALVWTLATGARRGVARIERRLDELAFHDPVTRLYNRHAATEHLIEYTAQARAGGTGFSVVSFDLDDFKTINDNLGHPIGDAVLRELARRLLDGLPPGARAYRFGGDEFVAICPFGADRGEPAAHGQLIRHMLSGVLRIEGYELSLSGSVGVARYPEDGEGAVQGGAG